MIRFDYGANSSNFVLNKRTLVPTALTGKVGMPNVGVHITIGMSPDGVVQQAFSDWMRTVYTSLSAMANRTAVQHYTDNDVAHYLQFCAIMDVVMAEAKRDLTMIHFGDLYSTNAVADYWGPAYASVIQDVVENGPKYWSRWNTLARKMSEMYPHLTIPYYEQFRYLLSTVFQDSDTGRWNFIYMHCFNQSFLDDDASAVSPIRALIVAEDLLAKFELAVSTNSSAVDPQSVGLTAEKVAAIKADLLNAYGAGVDRTYGYVIDFHTMPTSTYDADLVALLNNNVPAPDIYVISGSVTNPLAQHIHSYHSFSDASQVIANALTGTTSHGIIGIEDKVVFATSGAAQAETIASALTTIQTYPLTLYGPAFDGAPGLFNTSLIQTWDPVVTTIGENVSVVVNPASHFGLTTGQFFYYSAGGVDPRRVLLSSGMIIGDSNKSITGPYFAMIVGTINALNHMDCGNYIVWNTRTGSYITLGEPVDEFAIISRDSLATYTSSGVFGLFAGNTTKFRTTRAAEYVTKDNSAYVKAAGPVKESDRNGKKSKKKFKSKAE